MFSDSNSVWNTPAAPLTIKFYQNYNPAAQTDWNSQVAQSVEGVGVDLGGYGPRGYLGAYGTPTAVSGAVNVPAYANIIGQGVGVGGYARGQSTITNAVALYGEAHCDASNAHAWALNTVVIDNDYATAIWGYECDVNITNANTVVRGVNAVGGSTVEPSISYAFSVDPIGVGTTPPKRWSHGYIVNDGAAVTGVQIGAARAAASSGSMPLVLMYRPGSNVPTVGAELAIDASGNAILMQPQQGSLLALQVGANVIMTMLATANGPELGFFNAPPVAKPTVSGSRSSGAALASLITALAALGLITDGTTA